MASAVWSVNLSDPFRFKLGSVVEFQLKRHLFFRICLFYFDLIQSVLIILDIDIYIKIVINNYSVLRLDFYGVVFSSVIYCKSSQKRLIETSQINV